MDHRSRRCAPAAAKHWGLIVGIGLVTNQPSTQWKRVNRPRKLANTIRRDKIKVVELQAELESGRLIMSTGLMSHRVALTPLPPPPTLQSTAPPPLHLSPPRALTISLFMYIMSCLPSPFRAWPTVHFTFHATSSCCPHCLSL